MLHPWGVECHIHAGGVPPASQGLQPTSRTHMLQGPWPSLAPWLLPRPAPARRYLLQLDGITASRRFATLLSMNSLVLKQESLQLEW